MPVPPRCLTGRSALWINLQLLSMCYPNQPAVSPARCKGVKGQRYWRLALCAGKVVLISVVRWVLAEISIVSGLSSFKDENGEVLPCFSIL